MNKKLLFAASVMLALVACRGGRQPMTPVEEEDIEYRPLVTDSAAIDSIAYSGLVDNEAALEVPDIPQDKDVNMNASDVEITDIMSGGNVEEIKK